MKRTVFVFALAAAVAAVAATGALAKGRWAPGSGYYVRESAVERHFNRVFDSTNCSGIPRFGHRKRFPYGRFRVFYCDTKRDNRLCFAIRVKVVKGLKRGWFRTIPLNLSKVRCTGVSDVPAPARPSVAQDQSQLRAATDSVRAKGAWAGPEG